jgi:hypothetical protein
MDKSIEQTEIMNANITFLKALAESSSYAMNLEPLVKWYNDNLEKHKT